MSNNALPRYHTSLPLDAGSLQQRPLFHTLVYIDRQSGKVVSMGMLSQQDALFWRRQLTRQKDQGPYQVVLYDAQLRAVVAGEQIPLQELRNNTDFVTLENQLKLFNGDVHYTDTQVDNLRCWIQKAGLFTFQNAFQVIHNERPGRFPLANSALGYILEELTTAHF